MLVFGKVRNRSARKLSVASGGIGSTAGRGGHHKIDLGTAPFWSKNDLVIIGMFEPSFIFIHHAGSYHRECVVMNRVAALTLGLLVSFSAMACHEDGLV